MVDSTAPRARFGASLEFSSPRRCHSSCFGLGLPSARSPSSSLACAASSSFCCLSMWSSFYVLEIYLMNIDISCLNFFRVTVNAAYTATDCRLLASSFNTNTSQLEVRWELFNSRGARFVKVFLTNFTSSSACTCCACQQYLRTSK